MNKKILNALLKIKNKSQRGLFFIILCSSTIANAYVTDKIISGDTIESIAKRNIDHVKIKYGENYKGYEEDIKKWNPEITDWKNPPKNKILYIDYPYDHYLSGSTWVPILGSFDEDAEFNQKFSLYAFYASSFGTYKEITNEQTAQSGQNFPVTLGFGMSLTNEEKKHFLVSSFYWAQASKGNVTINNGGSSDFSTPGEIGGNLYYQYYLKNITMGFYTGYDFEKLNTFNTAELVTGTSIKNVDNQIHYATVGIAKNFSLFDLNMNLKASVSKTIASNTSGTKALSGLKYILYYTYKPEGRFSFSAFYKHHSLKGPTDLSIDRAGFSVGILVF